MTLAECQGKTVDKHLSFQKGELIHVREQKDSTWYSGQLHGKVNLQFIFWNLKEKKFSSVRLVGFHEVMFDQLLKMKLKILKILQSKLIILFLNIILYIYI